MAGEQKVEESRGALGLIAEAFRYYRRYPLLFLILAAAVIVPYELIVLAATGTGPFARGSVGVGTSLLLTLIELALIAPLISALHIHALVEAREGRAPKLGPVARRGLQVLPVVAATSIMSTLGIALGFLLLIVPGVILLLRWAVAAQVAAIDDSGWQEALRRSTHLAKGNYLHIIAFLLAIGVIVFVPNFLIARGFGPDHTDAVSFIVGMCLQIVTRSFTALATAVLYFDLLTRLRAAAPRAAELEPTGDGGSGSAPESSAS